MFYLVSVIAVDETRQCRGVPVDVCVQEQSAVCFLVELGEFALLLVLVPVVADQYLGCSDGGT